MSKQEPKPKPSQAKGEDSKPYHPTKADLERDLSLPVSTEELVSAVVSYDPREKR